VLNGLSTTHGIWLMLAAPVLMALAAIAGGKEAGWDLQNYHWYIPYALINHRLGIDIAVAHHATYYNPLLDMPLYWLGTHGPAWLVGAFLGALFGVVVALVGAIAYQVLAGSTALRVALATLVAVCGISGAGALLALGDTANDVPAAIGVFAALWMLLRCYAQLRTVDMTWQLSWLLVLAGLCAGVSAGLKLTTATYALGLLIATFVTPRTWSKRCSTTALLGIGMLCGFLLVAGWWFWRMWEYGHNPLFPYFNHWFHSPLLVEGSYRDSSSIDALSWRDKWLLPWLMTENSLRVSELQFRDARILIAYVLVPIATLVMLGSTLVKRHAASVVAVQPGNVKFLFCFAAVAYLAWLNMFCIYRYLVPLEMLAPLLITVAMLCLPISRTLQVAGLLGLAVVVQMTMNVDPPRQDWRGSYVNVQVPPLARLPNSVVLLAGTSPLAFVIPSITEAHRFLRIDGWMVHKDDRSSGLAREMRSAVAQHRGPLLLLFSPDEQARAVMAAQAYGLHIVKPCAAVTSNIAMPLQLCSLGRLVSPVSNTPQLR
jgi:hypothetical protein